jgi:hypothetical protein
MSAVPDDVIYSDQYFQFGQCLIGIISTLHAGNKIMLSVPQYKTPVHQACYMPIFNSLRLKYGIYPGILILENQNQIMFQSFEGMHQWHQMLPIVKCLMPYDIINEKDVVLGWKESVSLDYMLSAVENQVTNIVHRDTRNALSRISLTENMALQEMNKAYSVTERPTVNVELYHEKDVPMLVRDGDETNSLLPLLAGSCSVLDYESERIDDYKRVHEEVGHRNPADPKKTSVSKASSSYNLSFSSSKTKPKVNINIADILNYRILSESYGCENVQSCDPLETTWNNPPRSFMNQKTLTVPEGHALKHGHATSSDSTDIQESSFSSIEPYPLPEAPSLLLLEPLLLMQQDTANESRTPMLKKHKGRKEQLTHSEQQKVARIMIGYTLAFFLLAIVTFYVVYFL